jgi:hypothetical protein
MEGVARKRDRARLLQLTEALIREFAEQLPAGAVIACVARCKSELISAGVRNGLPVATEAAARIRLTSLVATRGCLISA